VLWCFRERPSGTTHISPYTLVYGTLPKSPLSVLKESWAGERPLSFSIGKNPKEYFQSLKANLEMARTYADYYSEIEQKKYATYYNLRSTDRRYQLGVKVAILFLVLVVPSCITVGMVLIQSLRENLLIRILSNLMVRNNMFTPTR